MRKDVIGEIARNPVPEETGRHFETRHSTPQIAQRQRLDPGYIIVTPNAFDQSFANRSPSVICHSIDPSAAALLKRGRFPCACFVVSLPTPPKQHFRPAQGHLPTGPKGPHRTAIPTPQGRKNRSASGLRPDRLPIPAPAQTGARLGRQLCVLQRVQTAQPSGCKLFFYSGRSGLGSFGRPVVPVCDRVMSPRRSESHGDGSKPVNGSATELRA